MADNKAASKTKKLTKTAMYQELADTTKLTRKQVGEVFDALAALIKKELGKKGPGEFTLPGLVKLKRKHVPAKKAEKKENPFRKGEMMEVKAKPAHYKVGARIMKALRDQVK